MKNINQQNIFEILEKLIGTKVDEDDTTIQFSIEKTSKKVLVNKQSIIEVLEDLNDYTLNEASVFNKNNYLVALKSGYIPFLKDGSTSFDVCDIQNKIEYSIKKMPVNYFISIIDSILIYDSGDIEEIKRNMGPYSFFVRHIEEFEKEDFTLEEFLNYSYKVNVISILSEQDKTFEEFSSLLSSYIFTISYNFSHILVPHKYITDIFPRRIINHYFRNKVVRNKEEFDPPRRKYINELVSYYLMGLVSENPYLEYLSYYHVIEYFFDSVTNEDLINKVKNKITLPDFSYKRKSDILDLVKLINNSTQTKNSSELNALKLTIKKFIDINELKTNLSQEYIIFLKENNVKFSNGNKINWDNKNIDNIYGDLASRIYNTRNALVHSKELENSKYKPFQDEKLLSKEIPLVRVIAEKLIILSATNL